MSNEKQCRWSTPLRQPSPQGKPTRRHAHRPTDAATVHDTGQRHPDAFKRKKCPAQSIAPHKALHRCRSVVLLPEAVVGIALMAGIVARVAIIRLPVEGTHLRHHAHSPAIMMMVGKQAEQQEQRHCQSGMECAYGGFHKCKVTHFALQLNCKQKAKRPFVHEFFGISTHRISF